jgi:hypothetical protein
MFLATAITGCSARRAKILWTSAPCPATMGPFVREIQETTAMTNNGTMPNIPVDTIAETENYTIWTAAEPDGETTFHLELGPVTAHFFNEEWAEFLTLIRGFISGEIVGEEDDFDTDDEDELEGENATEVELDWGSLYFTPGEWQEFTQLIEQV